MAERYIPPYEELQADARLLLRGFTNKIRCDACNKRLTWATDTEVKDGQPLYLQCTCGREPSWYDADLTDLTYRHIVEAWEEVFGDMFPDTTKQHSYVFDRFIEKLKVRQFLTRVNKQESEKKQEKTAG